jgi:hypothetical protein
MWLDVRRLGERPVALRQLRSCVRPDEPLRRRRMHGDVPRWKHTMRESLRRHAR